MNFTSTGRVIPEEMFGNVDRQHVTQYFDL